MRALGTVGNSVQLWLWIEQALGSASEFPEEALSTTEVLLISSTLTPRSLESPALLGAACRSPAGSRCLVFPGTVLQSLVAHLGCLGAPSAADGDFRTQATRGPWV